MDIKNDRLSCPKRKGVSSKGLMKKILSVLLAAVLTSTMCLTGLAAETESGPEDASQVTDSVSEEAEVVEFDVQTSDAAENDVSGTGETDESGTEALEKEEEPEILSEEQEENEVISDEILLIPDAAGPASSAEAGEKRSASVSEWLSDYTFTADEDTITLTAYTGSETDITVPGSAVVDGTEYTRILISAGLWPDAVRLAFEDGVEFPSNADSLFAGMSALTEIDVSNIDTSNVTSMQGIFMNCASLSSLDLSGFVTRKVTNFKEAFMGCSSLTYLDISGFYMWNVKKYPESFIEGCNLLETIKVPADFGYYIELPSTFRGADNIFYGQFPTEAPESMTLTAVSSSDWLKGYTFSVSGSRIILKDYIGSETEVVIPGSAVVDGTEYSSVQIKTDLWWPVSLKFGSGVILPENSSYLFGELYPVESIDLSKADTSNVKDMSQMFFECECLTDLDLSGFDTAKVTDMSGMFEYCGVKNLDLGGFNTSNVTDMSYMFYGLNLQRLDLSAFDTSNVTNISHMFAYCTKLTNLDISGFDLSNLSENGFSGVFDRCEALEEIKVPAGIPESVNIGLPSAFEDSDGNLYTSLPTGLSESITLTAFNGTTWQSEYTYDVSDDMITLKTYKGTDTEIIVPGSAVIHGKTYKVRISKQLWPNAVSLTLEKGVILPDDCSKLFYNMSDLQSIDLSNVDTSNVTNMQSMFEFCFVLQNLDLSSFDTSNVTDMHGMFLMCDHLQNLDLSSFDTSNVINMNVMFGFCGSLQNLDLSSFDTSKVTDMGSMFGFCQSLKNVDLGSFDTSNVSNMSSMFSKCSELVNLDLSSFDTRNVSDMSSMFFNCSDLANLDLRNFDFSSVTDTEGFLSSCFSLTSLTVPAGLNEVSIKLPTALADAEGNIYSEFPLGLSESTVLTLPVYSDWLKDYRFILEDNHILLKRYMGSEKNITVPCSGEIQGTVYQGVNIGQGIWSNTDIESLVFEEGVTVSGTGSSLFKDLKKLKSIDLSGLDTTNVTDMSAMFQNCQNLESLDSSGFDTTNVTSMAQMFENCQNLRGLDVSSFDTSNVEDMNRMFSSCSSLTSLDVSSFDTSNVSNMEGMFSWCSSLTSLDVSGFDTSNVEYMGGMFGSCENLTQIDLKGFNTSKVTEMGGMFNGCSNLEKLDLSSFDTSSVSTFDFMFNKCSSLETLDLSSFDFSNVEEKWELPILDGCRNLIAIYSPIGLEQEIALPAIYTGSDGASYKILPLNMNRSITLTWSDTFEGASGGSVSTPDGRMTIISGPDSVNIPSDTETTFSIWDNSDLMGEVYTYQWQYTGAKGTSWHNFAGVNGASLTKTVKKSWDGWKIRCLVTNENGDKLSSRIAKITIVDAVIITDQPADVEAMAGSTVEFSITAESFDGSPLTYQWQYQGASAATWNNFVNANNSSVSKTLQKSWNGWKIRCVVTDQSGRSKASDSAVISIAPDPITIIQQPESAEVPADTGVTFSVAAESSRGEALSYQWQYQGASSSKWNSFAGENTPSMTKTVRNSWNGWKVRCIVTDTSGNSAVSEAAVITITEDPVRITSQPESVTTQAKKDVTFTVGAESLTGESLSYQWQYQGASSTKWNNFANAVNASMTKTIQSSWNGWKVRCIVTDTSGNSAVSEAAVITITEDPVRITSQPESVTTQAKKDVTFTVGAESLTGESLSYQWQYQGASSTKWNNFANAVNASMTKTIQSSWNGWKVRCIVTDTSGNSAVSEAAVITITEDPVRITSQPESVTTQAKKNVTFNVKAESATGEILSYQWQYQGASSTKWNNFANATASSMTKTVQSSWNGWKVRCVVTDGSGDSVISDKALITVE